MEERPEIDGTLHVTDDRTVPAPAWYEQYEGPVEIVTPAFTVVIESRETMDGSPRKLEGETAPFPLEIDPWLSYGGIAGKGLDRETAAKTEWTQPDKILFEIADGRRLYRIDGLDVTDSGHDW